MISSHRGRIRPGWLLPVLLPLLLLVGNHLVGLAQAQAQTTARLCAIAEMAPVVTVAYHPKLQTYTLVSEGSVKDDDKYWPPNDDDAFSDNSTATISSGGNSEHDNNSTTTNNNTRHLTPLGDTSSTTTSLASSSSFLVPSDSYTTVPPNNNNNNNNQNDYYASFIDNNNQQFILARECPCARSMYCPVEHDMCIVPAAYAEPVECYTDSNKKTLLRNAWPLILLWYSTLLFFLMCTDKGRNARHYMMVKCCRQHSWNERIVDHFLYTHGFISTNPFQPPPPPSQRGDNNGDDNHTNEPQQRVFGWLPVARPIDDDDEDDDERLRHPTELVLKTRIYGRDGKKSSQNKNNSAVANGDQHSNSNSNDADENATVDNGDADSAREETKDQDNNDNNYNNNSDKHLKCDDSANQEVTDNNNSDNADNKNNNNNDDDEACCTICFSPLEIGDRVGDLPCQHTFHVHCLREWLPRRNVCPLCQNDNAATPRYGTTTASAAAAAAGRIDDEDEESDDTHDPLGASYSNSITGDIEMATTNNNNNNNSSGDEEEEEGYRTVVAMRQRRRNDSTAGHIVEVTTSNQSDSSPGDEDFSLEEGEEEYRTMTQMERIRSSFAQQVVAASRVQQQ